MDQTDLKNLLLRRMDSYGMRRVLQDLKVRGDHGSLKAMEGLLAKASRATASVLVKAIQDTALRRICEDLGLPCDGERADLERQILGEAPAPADAPDSVLSSPPPPPPQARPWDPPDVVVAVRPQADLVVPFDHQQAAWDALTRHFGGGGSGGTQAGIVVVPTGGGKTEIATRWLLRHHVRGGGRVLWFAHRRSLLRQAFNNVARNAHLAAPLERLGLIRVSAEDARWSNVSAGHHFVFSSVQSAATERSLGFLDRFARDADQPVFVVVDEAHHAAAPSYQRVLGLLKRLGARVLGLTATPVRMLDADDRRLWEVFDRRCIYQVGRGELIDGRILALPRVETVRTHVEAERDFTAEEHAHLGRFGDLAPSVLSRLAQHAGRNRLIVQHYLAHAERYGKTIVFAADAGHAHTLAGEFRGAGVDADYVAYTRDDCQPVMDAFRGGPSPRVLVNVEMLTEGYDAPATQTVFIARPTRSDALLSQMVGRALRGPRAGGTAEAHLVTFVDTWRDYHVLDTRVVVPDDEPAEPPTGPTPPRGPLVPVAIELVDEAYKLVNSVYRGHFVGFYDCLPRAWYVWDEETEGDLVRRYVMVFENQREGYDRLHRDVVAAGKLPGEVSEAYVGGVLRDYFDDVPDPLPAAADLVGLLGAYAGGTDVAHHTFEAKREFDPDVLAERFGACPWKEVPAKLKEVFDANAVCRSVYRDDFDAFRKDVLEAVGRASAPPPPPVVDLEVPEPTAPLRAWPVGRPGYDLADTWAAVTSVKAHFPHGVPRVEGPPRFSPRLTSTWGFYRFGDRSIRLSGRLDSPDVPLYVVEFVTYHEALHADMPESGHNREFRRRESNFTPTKKAVDDARERGVRPGSAPDAWRVLADQFLDTFHSRFLTGTGRKPPRF